MKSTDEIERKNAKCERQQYRKNETQEVEDERVRNADGERADRWPTKKRVGGKISEEGSPK